MTQAVFGIIGAGGIANSQHLPNLTRAPHVRLKTVCDLDAAKVEETQAVYGIPCGVTAWRSCWPMARSRPSSSPRRMRSTSR